VLDISPFYSSYYSGKYNMGAPSKIYQLARRGKANKVDVIEVWKVGTLC
jgi:hypothetical protein